MATLNTNYYIENFRHIRLFKIVYSFSMSEYKEYTGYFLAFEFKDAISNCKYQYSVKDFKYIDIISIENMGHINGINHFIR